MEELAEVYARSLFEIAVEHDALDDIHDQLGMWADALAQNRELQIFFFSPRFSSSEKKQAIRKIIDGGDERFVNFLELLAERTTAPPPPGLAAAEIDLLDQLERGPRPIREYKISMTQTQMTAARWVLLGGLPGSVLLLGSLVWVRRRR